MAESEALMNDFLNYGEYGPDMCEYNPRCIELEKELRSLVRRVEKPQMSMFQGFMKKLLLLSSAQN